MPSEVPDQMKNDFQNAKKRNLHTWTQWRMMLNNSLVDAVLTSSEVQDVEPFRRFMNHEVPDPDHPTTNPKTLLTYSASENSSTNLRRTNFYTYGIPRVKLSPNKIETINRNGLGNFADGYCNTREFGNTQGREFGNTQGREFGLHNRLAQPEEVAMDYFGYEEPGAREELGRMRGVVRAPPSLYSGQYQGAVTYRAHRNTGHQQPPMQRLLRFPIAC